MWLFAWSLFLPPGKISSFIALSNSSRCLFFAQICLCKMEYKSPLLFYMLEVTNGQAPTYYIYRKISTYIVHTYTPCTKDKSKAGDTKRYNTWNWNSIEKKKDLEMFKIQVVFRISIEVNSTHWVESFGILSNSNFFLIFTFFYLKKYKKEFVKSHADKKIKMLHLSWEAAHKRSILQYFYFFLGHTSWVFFKKRVITVKCNHHVQSQNKNLLKPIRCTLFFKKIQLVWPQKKKKSKLSW